MSESTVSQSAIYVARPEVRVSGRVDDRIAVLLTAMRVEESDEGLATLELRLNHWAGFDDGTAGYAFVGGNAIELGAAIEVLAGDSSSPVRIFKGHVSALELVCNYGQPPELVLLAEDKLAGARRLRRSKVHADKTPADLARAIAADHGLTPRIEGFASPQGTWAQLNESDLAFLRRVLGGLGAEVHVDGNDLHVAPAGDGGGSTVELALYGQLARARVLADLAHQATGVTVAGWNPTQGSAVSGEASGLTHAGPGEGTSGAEALQQAFGTRSEHLGQPAVTSDDEARAYAEAAFDQRARRFVRAEGVAEGNPALRVGTRVRLTGLGPQFSNTYLVVLARHLFDMRQGYRTEFEAQCAYLGHA
jgi:phage protein D